MEKVKPIRSAIDVLTDILKAQKLTKKQVAAIVEGVNASAILDVKRIATDDLAAIAKKEFGGAMLVRISNYPVRGALVTTEARVDEVRGMRKQMRKENRLAFLAAQIEESADASKVEVSKVLIGKWTKIK